MIPLPKPLNTVLLFALSTLPYIPCSHAVAVRHPTHAQAAVVRTAYIHDDPISFGVGPPISGTAALYAAFRNGYGGGVVRQTATSSGLSFTGQPCVTSADCDGQRKCLGSDDDGEDTACKQSVVPCRCLPEESSDIFCSCRDPCLTGDRCIQIANGGGLCIFAAANFPSFACGPDSGGFTGEVCSSTAGCADGRVCTNTDPAPDCSVELCNCVPSVANQSCDCEDPSCLAGDFCTVSQTTGNSFCLSKAFDNSPLQCNSSPSTPPAPTSDIEPTTEPPSSSTSEVDDTTTLGPTSQPNPTALPSSSTSEADDNPPEAPTSQPNPADTPVPSPSDLGTAPVPTGASTSSPTPTPSLTEDVCVDARMLSGFEPNELLYNKHPVSRVLCDRSGSCATPGHIVHYKGSAMMMKSYCEMVGCEKAVMEVNSPKYRRGVRVGSKTDGLHFTAFAARYGTKAEEGLMAVAVRIGL